MSDYPPIFASDDNGERGATDDEMDTFPDFGDEPDRTHGK